MIIRAIFWDFDGVILDSMPIREEGFVRIFKDYEKRDIDKLLDFHRKNGGLSRYVKIRYFFEEVLQVEVEERLLQKLASDFSDIMKKELVKPKYLITETMEFIREYSNKTTFHIVSGSDQNELRYLCEELKISPYFASIHGSPTPKKELVANLIKDFSYQPEELCLIGDSINDYEAAIMNHIQFFGYNNPELKEITLGNYISSFKNLDSFFK